jgi:Phage capsid family
MAAAVQLSNVTGTLLPPTITEPIFAKASEVSAIQQLARKVPLSITAQTAIPVTMDVPVAGWVAEGGVKPAAQGGVGVKLMTGKKLALLLPVSQEVAMTNAAGLYAQIEADLPTSLARSFDQAAINGKDLRSGGAGPFSDYLAMANNTVALGTATQATGGLYTDIVNGAGKVVDRNFDFTGIAADPRFKIDAMLQTDTLGRPLFVDQINNAGNSEGTLAGFPASFSKGVSGKYWRAGDATQVVTINGVPTGGTFLLQSGGNSAPIAYNAAAATVQTAVQAWGGVYAGVTVAGSAGGPYTFTFPTLGANVNGAAAPFTANQSLLTGGTAAASKATVAATGAGGVDSLLRGVGGDFSQCAYGVGMDISIKVSNEASYYDGTTWHSAFQENLVLLLVEAYYGFVVGDANAFVLYTKGAGLF